MERERVNDWRNLGLGVMGAFGAISVTIFGLGDAEGVKLVIGATSFVLALVGLAGIVATMAEVGPFKVVQPVRANVTKVNAAKVNAAELLALHHEQFSTDADRLTEPFIGQTIQHTGELRNVDGWHDAMTNYADVRWYGITLGVPETTFGFVRCAITSESDVAHLALMKRGDRVAVTGTIAEVTQFVVRLRDCELD